jgi:uncharacterized protein YlxW (UPF0749 family)
MRTTGRAAMTAVLLLLGFLVVVQLNSQTANNALNNLTLQELGELVGNLTTRNDQLRREVSTLERQRDGVASTVERGDSSVAQIRSDLNRVLAWSGALGVSGPGVRVTVTGELPGSAVETVLNELRNAGAEAVSIGSIRVVPGVVVSGPPGSLMATGVPLSDPVEIFAVGQPETLAGSLTRSGGPIAQLAARFPDVVIAVSASDRLDIPPTDHDLAPVLGKPRL